MQQRKQEPVGETCRTAGSDACGHSLVEDARLRDGDYYLASTAGDGTMRVQGLYDGATGHVYACNVGEDPRSGNAPCPAASAASTAAASPAVRVVGDLDGATGQVTVLQPDGSYRRFSRWDRISQGSPAQPDAMLRTLPQCGCGGSLGMPKLFDSFAEMSAYFFYTFYLDDTGNA